MINKLYYLAHPYDHSSKTPTENVMNCIYIVNKLMDLGYHIYAPIVMTHWLHCDKPRTWEFWMHEDEHMMKRCDGIILADEWSRSKGCLKEKELFEEMGKEVLFYEDLK